MHINRNQKLNQKLASVTAALTTIFVLTATPLYIEAQAGSYTMYTWICGQGVQGPYYTQQGSVFYWYHRYVCSIVHHPDGTNWEFEDQYYWYGPTPNGPWYFYHLFTYNLGQVYFV